MRIAIVTDSYYPTRDGVVTAVVTCKSALEDMGHEVFIVAPDPGEEFREDGVYYCPAKKFKGYEGYFRPKLTKNKIKVLESLNPDVIHIYGCTIMALKGLVSSHYYGIPTVQTFVTMVNEVADQYVSIRIPKKLLNKLVNIYLRNELKRPNALIVPTPSIARELEELGVKSKRLDVISIGIDSDVFVRNDRGQAIRERHGLVGKKVAIAVGRLSYEKNTGLIIRSLKLLDDDVCLLIAGKGPMEKEWKDLAISEGLEDRVIFAGFVPDEELVSYYSCADIAVSASKFETQGLTTLEAMGCGLPAICANGRAFMDVIEPGVNGYLFETTEEDCARAMKLGFENCSEIAVGARETAERNSMKETARRLVEVYRAVTVEKSGKE